ncbi:MAG: AI-2E family transporter [Clostridia bacterium]|nr:AI-2E family transporter [Clostridia bacterium]
MKKIQPQTKRIMILIVFAAVVYTAMQNIGLVYSGLKAVLAVFNPVIIGLCLAFILNVLLTALENKPFAFMSRSKHKFVQKLKRPICMILTYLIAFGIIIIMIVVIIPELYQTLVYIGERMPGFAKTARAWLEGLLVRFNISKDVLPDYKVNWTSIVSSAKKFLTKNYNNIFGNAVNITASVAGSVANVVFGVIISGYVLAQKEKIERFMKSFIDAFISHKAAGYIYHISERTYFYFSKFIGGQLIEAVILGTLCFIGMTILRLPNSAVISVLICVTALIPIIGATIGMVVGFLLILITSPIKAVIFVVFLLVLQQIEGNLIYPKVVGKSVGLPGVIVISAVLVGGNIGGVVGALLGVPLCAVIYALLKEAIAKRNPPAEELPEQSE